MIKKRLDAIKKLVHEAKDLTVFEKTFLLLFIKMRKRDIEKGNISRNRLQTFGRHIDIINREAGDDIHKANYYLNYLEKLVQGEKNA
jgi:transcriptional regulator